MPTAVVLGGSVIGSAAALLLARAGWSTTVVDPELPLVSDPDRPPAPRPGAPHAVQAHGFPARAALELRGRLPDVLERLYDAGAEAAAWQLPPFLADGGRPGDHDLDSFRTRRHLMDRVLAQCVAEERGVTALPVRVRALTLETGTTPRVTGLVLTNGRVVEADVVVDAAGRRSPVAGWLAGAGVELPVRTDHCGLSYYGRHFRIRGPRPPLNAGFADVHEFASHLQFLFVGDNDHVQVALSPHADDLVMKRLRHEDAYTTMLARNEAFADWFAALEPVTPVFCLGSLPNRMSSLVDEGRPVVLGLHRVGDALATTNPNRGRGISMGLAALGVLIDALTTGGSDEDVAVAYGAWQRRVLAVYYRESVATDLELGRRLRANLLGEAAPPTAPGIELPVDHPVSVVQIERAAMSDPDLLRTFVRALNVMDDDRAIASPQVTERVLALTAEDVTGPATTPQSRELDDRRAVESLLAAWG